MDFWKSKEWEELSGLLTTAYLPGPTVGGEYLSLRSVGTPDGKMVLAAAVFDDIYPGSNFVEITDEKLLAKLRNIKGQFHNVPGTGDIPVFYYENLMSTADFKVFSKTGKILVKRQTSLADGIDALTTVMLNRLKAGYRGARENEFDLLLSHFSEEVSKFSESMKHDRFRLIAPKSSAESMALDQVSRPRSVSLKRLWHRIGRALARAGANRWNKLGRGGGLQATMVDAERPEGVGHLAIEISDFLNKRATNLGDGLDAPTAVMLTAIEATHGREKANEFDLLMARFSQEVIRRFPGEVR
jgi:hypothetical protein